MTDIESPTLSRRDREVLPLLSRGYTTRQVADELDVSVTTVKTYIHSAYVEIGVTRRAQAVVGGVRHGLSGVPAAESFLAPVTQS